MTITPAARERRRVRFPLFLAAATAWVLLAVAPPPMSAGEHHASEPHDHLSMSATVPEPSDPTLLGTVVHLLPGAALMVVAMMWPLLGPAVGHVHARSLARRRQQTVASFLIAYTLGWTLAATVLAASAAAATAVGLDPGVVLAAVLVVALVWEVSPSKQRCLNRTHRHPAFAAFGPAAVTDVVRFGTTHALWCVGSCWALMLIPFVVPAGHLPVMGVITLWLAHDRFATPTEPRWFASRRDRPHRGVPAPLRKRLRATPAAVHGRVPSGRS